MGRDQGVGVEKTVRLKVFSFRKGRERDLDEFEKVLSKRSDKLCEAIKASERLSAADYAVTINAR